MNTLIVVAELSKIEQCIGFVIAEAAVAGASEKAKQHINLACEEALVNIMSYAYSGSDKVGDVCIKCDVDAIGRFVVEIVDEGVAFDPLSRPEPDLGTPIEDRRVGGLGVFLLKNVMDEVRYERQGGKNSLTLIKGL